MGIFKSLKRIFRTKYKRVGIIAAYEVKEEIHDYTKISVFAVEVSVNTETGEHKFDRGRELREYTFHNFDYPYTIPGEMKFWEADGELSPTVYKYDALPEVFL